jgi:hypothetical protein
MPEFSAAGIRQKYHNQPSKGAELVNQSESRFPFSLSCSQSFALETPVYLFESNKSQ